MMKINLTLRELLKDGHVEPETNLTRKFVAQLVYRIFSGWLVNLTTLTAAYVTVICSRCLGCYQNELSIPTSDLI